MSKLLIKKSLHPQIHFGEDNLDGSFISKFKLSREFDVYRIKPLLTNISIGKDCSIYEYQIPPDMKKSIIGYSGLLSRIKSNLNHLEFDPNNLVHDNPKILRTADYLIIHRVDDYSIRKNYFTLIDNISNWMISVKFSESGLNYSFPSEKPKYGKFIELTGEEWDRVTCNTNLKSELTKYSRTTITIAELVSLIHPMEFYSLPKIK